MNSKIEVKNKYNILFVLSFLIVGLVVTAFFKNDEYNRICMGPDGLFLDGCRNHFLDFLIPGLLIIPFFVAFFSNAFLGKKVHWIAWIIIVAILVLIPIFLLQLITQPIL